MNSRTRSRRPASIGSNQSSRRWIAVSACDCSAAEFVLLLVMAWSPPALKRRDCLGFRTRRLRHLQFQPHPGRHLQEILPAYILSSPRRRPGSISPGHVPSRVSKALPLPENSGTAARWVPAFAGTTREYLIIPASMPISSHALSRGDEEKSLAESSVCLAR